MLALRQDLDSPEKPLLHSFSILWVLRQAQTASLHCAGMAISVRQIPKHSGSVARAALPQGEHSQAGDRGCPCKDRTAFAQMSGVGSLEKDCNCPYMHRTSSQADRPFLDGASTA